MANNQNLQPPWKPGQSGNPNGRPKNILGRLEEIIGKKFGIELSKSDKIKIIEWCMERSVRELATIIYDDESPAFLVNIAAAIHSDIRKGQTFTVQMIFDRIFGQIKKSGDTGEKENAESQYTRKEMEASLTNAFMNKLEDKYGVDIDPDKKTVTKRD